MFKASGKHLITGVAMIAFGLTTSTPASADRVTLSSGVHRVSIDPGTPGVESWFVGNISMLGNGGESYFVRLGEQTRELSLGLFLVDAEQSSPTELRAAYEVEGIDIDVTYRLVNQGSNRSTLIETLTVHNVDLPEFVPLDVFSYTNFDLNGTVSDSASATEERATVIDTFNRGIRASYEGAQGFNGALGGGAERFEVGDAANLLNKLQDGDADDLAFGPTSTPLDFPDQDLALAYQYSFEVGSTQFIDTFDLRVVKSVAVPVPAAIGPGLVLLGLVGLRRWRSGARAV